jgi:hypothetical protein
MEHTNFLEYHENTLRKDSFAGGLSNPLDIDLVVGLGDHDTRSSRDARRGRRDVQVSGPISGVQPERCMVYSIALHVITSLDEVRLK